MLCIPHFFLSAIVCLTITGCAQQAQAPPPVPPMQQPMSTASIPQKSPHAQPAPVSPVAVPPPAQPKPFAAPQQQKPLAAPAPEATPKTKREVEQVPPSALPDAVIIGLLIKASLASYPGNCPCPYNNDRAGRSCGRRSAHSRPGGASPLCYPNDVTPAMIEAYRKRHGGSAQR